MGKYAVGSSKNVHRVLSSSVGTEVAICCYFRKHGINQLFYISKKRGGSVLKNIVYFVILILTFALTVI